MRPLSFFLLAAFLAVCKPAFAAFPGNGYWGIGPNRKPRGEAAQPVSHRRRSYPLDIYPPGNPHFDNALYGRGLTSGGGNAYQNNEYRGRGASMSYGYSDGGFNPSLYGFSMYPHFDRPGFTYWQGGY